MRAGTLRQSVTLEQPVDTQDATGGMVRTWSAVATVRAAIEPVKAREFFQASATRAEMDTRIRIRWSADVAGVNETWRVRHDTTLYNIYSAAHVALRQREIELMCKSGVNEG